LPGDNSEPTLITCCPIEYIGEDWEWIEETMQFSRLYKLGLAPEHGGVLDQAQSFISVCDQIFELERFWEKKLGIF